MSNANVRAVKSSHKKLGVSDLILNAKQFNALAIIIRDKFGIDLPESKKDLIPRRLGKRLVELGFNDYSQYIAYLKQNWRTEEQVLANAITTNLTSFFREGHHFQYLDEQILPVLLKKNRKERKIRIWSAACSTGEEPYSIAMVLQKYAVELKNWDVKILATDLDTNILSRAYAGQYRKDQVKNINSPYLQNEYFSPVAGGGELFEISQQIRSLISFKRLNFMDSSWPMKGQFDVIFCRNALIYFDLPIQQQLINKFARLQLKDDYLLVGHSESLHDVTDKYDLLGKTVYQKK